MAEAESKTHSLVDIVERSVVYNVITHGAALVVGGLTAYYGLGYFEANNYTTLATYTLSALSGLATYGATKIVVGVPLGIVKIVKNISDTLNIFGLRKAEA